MLDALLGADYATPYTQSATATWTAYPSIHGFASARLGFLEKRRIPVIEHKAGPTNINGTLIACALTEKTPTSIATVDRALRSALASQDVPVIYPRTRRGLVAERFHF